MAATSARFASAADILPTWRDEVLSGKGPKLYPIGAGELARIEIGPGLVTLLGGAPGAGKTAFTMQAVTDALRLSSELRVLVANVEMAPGVLLDRQLARLSGVDLTTIRYRKLGAEHADRIDQAMNTLEAIAERICFVRAPFTLANIAAAGDAFDASMLVLDYVQRIAPDGTQADRRGGVDATMSFLRQFTDNGQAVIAVSALGRTKDGKGRSSYDGDGLGLASFRESSELEYGADDAFILTPARERDGTVTLRHLKARNGAPADMHLSFDGALQRFEPTGPKAKPRQPRRRAKPADDHRDQLAKLWASTEAPPAAGDE